MLERFPETSIIIDLKSLPKEPLVEALINTVSDEEAWEKALILNVDGVYTDNPEKIIEAKKRQKVSSLRG
ncbi:MAG: hypothetical protein JSR76_01705 [Verrucomicrobia bacterium]|nr:hypothetical protein [Verrucomicrobiota bacterium]